jgi:multidrug resistance efflux pump
MDLVAQIDKLLAQVRSTLAYADYEDGREEALMEARTLAKAYVQAQVDLVARLVKENTAWREQGEEAAQALARAQGLVHPGHRSLRELVEGLVDELARADGHGKD